MPRLPLGLSLAACLLLGSPARAAVNVYANPNGYEAQTPALAIGAPAPALAAAAWVNGDPIPRFEPGTVYLVEFWATWCQPCQKSLPHLNELQKTYRGRKLRVVGVAAAEERGLEGLKAFVGRTRLEFPVAYVDDAAVFDRWMHGARVSGLPWVFVIDRQGRLAWWGQHFYADFEAVVRRAVAGTLELPAEAARRARNVDRDRRGWALKAEVWKAHNRGDREGTLALLDDLCALDPERFWAEVNLKARLLLEKPADRERGLAFAREAIERLVPRNPHALTQLAQAVRGLSQRRPADLALAARAAKRASELTRGNDREVQETLASIKALQEAAK